MSIYFDPFQEIKTQKSLLDKTIFKSFCRMKSWNSLRGPVVFGCFRQKILCVNTFVFLISPKRLIIQRRKGRFGSRLVERQRFQKRVLRITFTANGCKLVSAIHYFRCHHLSKKSESFHFCFPAPVEETLYNFGREQCPLLSLSCPESLVKKT